MGVNFHDQLGGPLNSDESEIRPSDNSWGSSGSEEVISTNEARSPKARLFLTWRRPSRP